MRSGLLQLINIAYYLFYALILARMILSWTRIGSPEIRSTVFRLTEPILAPIRRALPQSSGLDFSPMLALVAAWLIRMVLFGFL